MVLLCADLNLSFRGESMQIIRIAVLSLFLVSCGGGGSSDLPAPAKPKPPLVEPLIINVEPADGVAVRPGISIFIDFDSEIDQNSFNNFKVMLKGQEVVGEISYTKKSVSFKPTKNLTLLETYDIILTNAKTLDNRLIANYESSFSVVKGQWSEVTQPAVDFSTSTTKHITLDFNVVGDPVSVQRVRLHEAKENSSMIY